MNDWIDFELISGNRQNDSEADIFVPRNGVYSKSKNFGTFAKQPKIKNAIKILLSYLVKAHKSKIVLASLINYDSVAIRCEKYRTIEDTKTLVKQTLLEVDLMIEDTRADSSTEWVILLSEEKDWCLLFHLKAKQKINIVGYDNGGLLNKIGEIKV